jgi:membrane protease YdiL (CAAX protease family)
VSALAFGWMHADMPGGLGIVRLVSALGLGLACGVARHHGRSIAVPIVLHALYNALSLATTRRWVTSEAFPMKLGVPTLLSLIGAAALLFALGILIVRRLRRA